MERRSPTHLCPAHPRALPRGARSTSGRTKHPARAIRATAASVCRKARAKAATGVRRRPRAVAHGRAQASPRPSRPCRAAAPHLASVAFRGLGWRERRAQSERSRRRRDSSDCPANQCTISSSCWKPPVASQGATTRPHSDPARAAQCARKMSSGATFVVGQRARSVFVRVGSHECCARPWDSIARHCFPSGGLTVRGRWLMSANSGDMVAEAGTCTTNSSRTGTRKANLR